ncbi:glutathione S-transferase family protein [uncultured Marinobacter sp.]|uniref:glutathione S-transferase family protein n=1 Tax=uncultured Marinobacter sp. TaxID=187379 RepID=UPI0030D82BBA
MIKLYHCMSARSFRALWALEETGTPCELIMLPFPPRVFRKDYLDINPLGTIPALFDGDTFMTESSAIAQYVAARYGKDTIDVAVEDSRFGAYLNWLHFGEATLTFPQTLVLRYTRLEPEERRNPQVAEDYKKWFLSRLRGVDRALTRQSPWLLGEQFTAADISVGYALMLADQLGMASEFTPAVADFWARCQLREGFQRALKRQQEEGKAQGVE